MFLLDTDHLGILQRQTEPGFSRLVSRMAPHDPAVLFVSIVSFHEQALGWNTDISRATNQAAVVYAYQMFQQVLTDFAQARVPPYDAAASAVYEAMRQQRVRVATMDLRIAAIAVPNDLIVLTRNTVDFGKVPGLRVEDWTA